MNIKFNSIQSVVAGVLAVTTVIVGCQDPDYPAAQPSTTGASTSLARVLFVNASPNAASLNLSVENSPVGTLTPGTSTTYVGVASGSAANASPQIRVSGAGGTLTTDLTSKATLVANTNYTVFVTDTINRPRVVNATTGAVTDAGGVRLLTVTDPISQTLTAGAGGVRFFHLAPDAGLPTSSTATTPAVVSVRLSAPTSTSTTVASFVNRAYRNVTSNTFTSVPAGTYRVDVFTGATVPTSTTVTPVASSTITVETAKLYTLYAQGLQRTRTLNVGRIQNN